MSTSLADECHRRAREARRSAEMTSMPSQKTHFLELEQRWLLAAESATSSIMREEDPSAEPSDVPRGRRTKFTPERIEQIKEMIALGRNRSEIAELMRVTVGSLQVTCSKLGISLRRRDPRPQVELPGAEEVLRATRRDDIEPLRPDGIADRERHPTLALAIEYRGRRRAVSLPLSNAIIARLALEAQIREMSLGQLLGAIIGGAVAGDLRQLLDAEVRNKAA
jgi:hypothetical protein